MAILSPTIEVIKRQKVQPAEGEYFNENIISTENLDAILRLSSKDFILRRNIIVNIIKSINSYMVLLNKNIQTFGTTEDSFKIKNILESFKTELYFAWEKYDYGHHSDFWQEGDSNLDYTMFEKNIKENLKLLINILKYDNPLDMFSAKSDKY